MTSFYEDYFNKPYAFVSVRTSGDAAQNENSPILTQNGTGAYVSVRHGRASQNHDVLLHSALELLLLGKQKTQDGEKIYFKSFSPSCSLTFRNF